jgi:hypothetical protein
VLLDANWHFDLATADVDLLSECSYISPHPIPQLIVVGIDNTDRNRDFTPTHMEKMRNMRFPTSGEAESFRKFLVEEALPLIDKHFRTTPFRVLAGWSLGGLFTIDTLLSEPSRFDAYLAISPSLWWDDRMQVNRLAAEDLLRVPDSKKRLVITLGSAEKGGMVEGSTTEFLDRLEKRPLPNVDAELVTIEGLGHNFSPKMAFFLGLATIFDDWVMPGDVVEQGLPAIEAYYRRLSARYRFDVPVPDGAYSKLGWTLFESDRKVEAGEVFSTWVERQPQSSLAVASLGSYYRETGQREKAISMLSRAIDLEEQSDHPRPAFISDLKRDIDGLQSKD